MARTLSGIGFLAVGLFLVACSVGAAAPELRTAGDGSGAASLPSIPANVPYSFGGTGICASRGSIQITGVTLYRARGGLKVVDWAVRPFSMASIAPGPGSDPSLASHLAGFTQSSVAVACSNHADSDELVVSVEKPTEATANADAILIHYRSGGEDRVLKDPLAIQLCSKTDHSQMCS